jgi:hypothetical protein
MQCGRGRAHGGACARRGAASGFRFELGLLERLDLREPPVAGQGGGLVALPHLCIEDAPGAGQRRRAQDRRRHLAG